ncbi:MAG TPA: T9SS type A sorting domain-containing protein [Bacteroidia bacterium]
MKKLYLLLLLLCSSASINAQIVVCDTLPLAYNPVMQFAASPLPSYGDSVLWIEITNNTTTNFAYPLVRIEPLGSMPNGFSLSSTSQDWFPFSSSWNVGQTATFGVFFDVTQPIPQDFLFIFNLYVSNFNPLAIDSCVFMNNVATYINPLSLQPGKDVQKKPFSFSPNPVQHDLNIKFLTAGVKNEIFLYDINGRLVRAYDTSKEELSINVSKIESGVYYLVSKDHTQKEKLVIVK